MQVLLTPGTCKCGQTFMGKSTRKLCDNCRLAKKREQGKAAYHRHKQRWAGNESPEEISRERQCLQRMDARQSRELDLTAPSIYRADSLAAAEAIAQTRNAALNRECCLTGAAGAVQHAVGGMVNATC